MGTKKNVPKVGNVDNFYTIRWISTLPQKEEKCNALIVSE
ncbi:hypothetical protein BOVA115_141 [Bacteroides ovatus]|jgi:hypothetical protein|nr:hypothetical protein BOVA115_141 [Bacteroides ovatus]